jgi:hypothetical protein
METTSEQALARINAALARIEIASQKLASVEHPQIANNAPQVEELRKHASEALAMLDSLIQKAESGVA